MTDASGKRRKDSLVDDFTIPKFRERIWSDQALREFERAAAEYAERNPSDPFARDRALLHLQRGIMDVSEARGQSKD